MKVLFVGAVAFTVLGVLIGDARVGLLAENRALGAPAEHPLVGSWSSASFLLTFSSDGTATGTDSAGLSYHGAWQPVGESQATYEMQALLRDGGGQGFMGPLIVHDSGDEMITNDATFLRIVAPDPAKYDFSTPEAS